MFTSVYNINVYNKYKLLQMELYKMLTKYDFTRAETDILS